MRVLLGLEVCCLGVDSPLFGLGFVLGVGFFFFSMGG